MSQTPDPPTPPDDRPPPRKYRPTGPVRLPSRRATALLAGTMLALGVGIGAAIGPAPDASLAGPGAIVSSVVVPYVNELERAEQTTASAPVQAAAVPVRKRKHRRRVRKHSGSTAAPASTVTTTTSTSSSTPASATFPPVTTVWLIELSGASFSEALAQPGSAPNIDQKIIPSGTLLSGWSALDAGAFASEAGLLAAAQGSAEGTSPTLQTITEPVCPEGAAGASCTAGTPGALSAADSFLEQTLVVITASSSYTAHGLVVVTFGTLNAGSATGLPSGSQTATLTAQPPAGVLLISPFAHAGARPATSFNPASPKQSLEKLLQR